MCKHVHSNSGRWEIFRKPLQISMNAFAARVTPLGDLWSADMTWTWETSWETCWGSVSLFVKVCLRRCHMYIDIFVCIYTYIYVYINICNILYDLSILLKNVRMDLFTKCNGTIGFNWFCWEKRSFVPEHSFLIRCFFFTLLIRCLVVKNQIWYPNLRIYSSLERLNYKIISNIKMVFSLLKGSH